MRFPVHQVCVPLHCQIDRLSACSRIIDVTAQHFFRNQSLTLDHAVNQNAVRGEQLHCHGHPVLGLHPEYLANAPKNESIHSSLMCPDHHFDVHVSMGNNQALTPQQGVQETYPPN